MQKSDILQKNVNCIQCLCLLTIRLHPKDIKTCLKTNNQKQTLSLSHSELNTADDGNSEQVSHLVFSSPLRGARAHYQPSLLTAQRPLGAVID